MKTNNDTIYCLFFCAFIFFSCTEEVEPEVEIMDPPEPIISILHPLEDEMVDYCFFYLEWEDESDATSYTVEVSKNKSFTEVVFDTLISDTSFEMTTPLVQGENYYWKVSATDNELTAESEFSVIDYVQVIIGKYYNVPYTYEYWALLDDPIDTSYRRHVQIYPGDSLGSISYLPEDGYEERNLEFTNVLNRHYVQFKKDPISPHYVDILRYFYKKDSIWIHSSLTANGGGSESNYYINRQ